jgi:RNA polymerase sigma-70 factor (ECF subfamily)
MPQSAIDDSQVTHREYPSTGELAPRAAWDDPSGEILMLLQTGDSPAALRLLMERYGDDVRRYCYRALRDTSLADDVRQQVFFQAYRDLANYRGCSSLQSWLFGIVRHRVLDAMRARHRMESRLQNTELATRSDAPDPRPSPAESLDVMRLHHFLEEALRRLSEPARSMVLLRYQSGLTLEEIAAMTGESAGTVHMRIARALPRLRKAIEARIS